MDIPTERRGRLENGAELVACPSPQLHSVAFSVVLPFTPECTPGVYHLVEHMFFERAGERRADEINAEMTARGSEIMGYTAINYMCFSFTCRPDVFLPQLELLFSMLSQREYEEADFERVLPVIRNEIFEAAFYDARSSDILRDLWFDSRYIAPVLGNADVLSRLDPEEIRQARASLFNRGMCLFLAGAFTPEHERRILDTFGKLPLRRRERTAPPAEEKVTREILKLAAHWLRSGLFDGLDAAFFRFFGEHGFQFYSVDGIYNIRGDELVFSYLVHITKKERKKFEPLIDAFEEEAARTDFIALVRPYLYDNAPFLYDSPERLCGHYVDTWADLSRPLTLREEMDLCKDFTNEKLVDCWGRIASSLRRIFYIGR